MQTGRIETWGGTPGDWGPLYPFVGYETLMLGATLLVCIGFIVWKFNLEKNTYDREVRELRELRKPGE